MALKWIESAKNQVAAAGWATLSSLVAIKDDTGLNLPELKQLAQRVRRTIQQAPDAVRCQMNGFLIALGSSVQPLMEFAIQIGEKIGPVTADLGNNSCQIPYAPDYIRKLQKRGTSGRNENRQNAERIRAGHHVSLRTRTVSVSPVAQKMLDNGAWLDWYPE